MVSREGCDDLVVGHQLHTRATQENDANIVLTIDTAVLSKDTVTYILSTIEH